VFLRESLNQPLILIFEDLHWIDSETQSFLDVLNESVANANILLLVNYRPEYRHEWGQKTYYTQLRLAPFGKANAEEFLTALLGDLGEAIGRSRLHQLILEKTEGTPFFMEEIVQELLEQGVLVRDAVGARRAMPLPTDLHIPPTVQGVLAARIDRLAPDEKVLLQQLAVIGREFLVSLIRQVISQPEDELYCLLAFLQRKEFLYEQAAFPESEYLFKHALTQDVAYSTVLHEQRKVLHERTGQALEALYATTLHEHYSALAYHYRRSASTEKAITYLHLAGQQAGQRSANAEAISHLNAAMELLLTRPETPERTPRELTLHLALGPVLMATQGWAAAEVTQHYTRARTLCEQLGNSSQRVPVLWGLWAFHLVRSELRTAQALAEECLQIAEQTADAGLLLEVYHAVGSCSMWRGEFARARAEMEQGIARYQPHQHHALAAVYGGFDPGMGCLSCVAEVLWLLGYPDQALTRSQEALRLVHELGHSFSLGYALSFATWLHLYRGEGRVAQERAEALIALASEHGFAFYWAQGTIQRGEVLIAQGQWEEGVAQTQQGLEALVGELMRPHHLALLAEEYGGAGQVGKGLAAVAEALRLVDKNDERLYEAEVYRIRGELTLQKFQVSGSKFQATDLRSLIPAARTEAEDYFLKAIEIAQRQQAKSLELRATTSLAHLWQQQGKRGEAHQMLSEIYNWFTEGFDTKDLREAKALIEELSH
jgi:hypothetical protein